VFNGLDIVQDRLHRVAGHAIDMVPATPPAALASSALPYLPGIKVLSRRDAVILYLPNVEGAADYRAYAYNPATVTYAGTQPRGAVVACAGYRRRGYNESATVPGQVRPQRELLQTIELPGFVASGSYTVVVEAIKTPCPFPGMPGHTDATKTHPQNAVDYPNDNTYMSIRSFEGMKRTYGNEIINGQGSLTSWADRKNPAFPLGLPVPADSTSIPADPVAIARSLLQLNLPFADENSNAPIFDVGPNSVFEDFSETLAIRPADMSNNPEWNTPWAIGPLATLPGRWTFWGAGANPVDTDGNNITSGYLGVQIFQRHGRLYTTFGDLWADVMSSLTFSSLKTLPQQLDSTKYVHSFFRVNSDATPRRYWNWMMCGDDAREKLVNTTTRMPTFRPIVDPHFFLPAGPSPNAALVGGNPSRRHQSEPDVPNRYNKECLLIIQEGQGELHPRNDGRERSASRLQIVIFPKDTEAGNIQLGSVNSDWQPGSRGFAWRVDAKDNYAGPLMEPFDQFAPLTHFDVFVRPDRLVLFVNGRQAVCVDLSPRPLTMKYGLLMYGDILYHTSAEQIEGENAGIGDYQYRLNTPVGNTRVWDAVGHAEKIDIPSVLTFDASLCRKPADTSVR
jgi:hypothetical protein